MCGEREEQETRLQPVQENERGSCASDVGDDARGFVEKVTAGQVRPAERETHLSFAHPDHRQSPG